MEIGCFKQVEPPVANQRPRDGPCLWFSLRGEIVIGLAVQLLKLHGILGWWLTNTFVFAPISRPASDCRRSLMYPIALHSMAISVVHGP
jgi:hypothetical protein